MWEVTLISIHLNTLSVPFDELTSFYARESRTAQLSPALLDFPQNARGSPVFLCQQASHCGQLFLLCFLKKMEILSSIEKGMEGARSVPQLPRGSAGEDEASQLGDQVLLGRV